MARLISRRRVLKAGIIAVPSVAVVAGGGIGLVWFTAPVDTVGQVAFRRPLAVPPLAASEIDGAGRRVFKLTARAGSSELLPGTTSGTWGFNGTYLGPTFRAARGETVLVNVQNQLDETTTVHWHGMHLPARFDGGPHQPIDPGDSWTPTWTIDQPAATLWYHPHPHGLTREHISRGLAGMFILDDPEASAGQALPHEYGVDDFPVIVQDRSFSDSGDIKTANFGDTILVNGTFGPYLDLTTELVRLRLLNASTARVYSFGFSDDREFLLIGTDGGLLPAPVSRRRVLLSPAERAEVVIRMSPRERVVLRSYQPDLGVDWFTSAFEGAKDRFDILELRAADSLAASEPIPDTLASPQSVIDDPSDDDVDREFELQGREINGLVMDMNRIDEIVEVDTTEIWQVTNTDGVFHNFHIHDVQFQITNIDGAAPPQELSGWKDTVFLRPGTTARLAMRFHDYTDPDNPYMFHCHRLRHEDRGMMGQFIVVGPDFDTPDSESRGGLRGSHHH